MILLQDDSLEMIHTRDYDLILRAISSVYQKNDLAAQITDMLGTIGEIIKASRVYVFEDDYEQRISKNTYEWCADGVAAQISELQCVPHEIMGEWHNMLRSDGIIKTNDMKKFPKEIYEILRAQGILSILVLPLYNGDNMFGYVGFDECRKYRIWSEDEIRMLRALSNLVTNMIERHKAEQKASDSRRVLHTVLDNIDTPIYATDIETSRILFANRKFMEEMECGNAEGALCWEIVGGYKTGGECEDCPRVTLNAMKPGEIYKREVYNERNGKWYYCSDRLIEWTDGKKVHLQSALDITARKEYEERLKFSATYDKMTGIYNRESGLTLLEEMMADGKREDYPITFCFFDADGLKSINDAFGHMEGDRLIEGIVGAMRGVIRASDVLARIGGDEFMLALRACPLKNAKIMFEKIDNRLQTLSRSGAYPYELSVSVGMLEITPDMNCGVNDVLAEADRLMYLDKQAKSAKR